MPKINVYLPDDLAAAVRQAGLSVSPICQRALAEAVRAVGTAREAADALRDPQFDPERRPQIPARIASQMTPRLEHALRRAQALAGADRPAKAEHALAGLIDEPGNLGVQVLRSLGVDVPELRDAAVASADAAPRGRKAGSRRAPRPSREELVANLAPATRAAIASALDAAVDFGHAFLGCEHLLLGLAEQPDQPAGELLRQHGVTPEGLRRVIPPTVAGAALEHQHSASVSRGELADMKRRLDELEHRLSAGGL